MSLSADNSEQSSREIIKKVLDFNNPLRIGMTLPEPYPHDMISGDRIASSKRIEKLPAVGNEVRRWKDEWGVTWASLTDFDKGEVAEAAINDWSELSDYHLPDLGVSEDYLEAKQSFEKNPDFFQLGSLPGFPFNIARKLRKLDNYLCDLIVETENVKRLNAMIENELLKAIDLWSQIGADAIMFCEDWGTQHQLMIAPEMWRELFKPGFCRLAGRAHAKGMYVFMHSCGKITDIIEDLIECGIDCLQFDQPTLHGIDNLAERFAGRVTFWCPVDIQRTLQTRAPELIRKEAKEMIDKLGGKGGGFIATYYSSKEALGLPPQIQDIAISAFVEYGNYTMPHK